jgi:solute carrier family 34 (sodium-dependent phosphate cotransporter)
MTLLKENIQTFSSKNGRFFSVGRKVVLITFLVLLFLISINLIGQSFTYLGDNILEQILIATSNPFVGLFIGLLLTAIIQSSSTSTSMIVAVVASGSLSLTNAVPIIMGANIGTTLTSSIVALSFITDKKEFSKAIAAGSVHDFFNILTAFILFPLEYYYGFLSFTSQKISFLLSPAIGSSSETELTFISLIIKPISKLIIDHVANKLIIVLLAFITLFASIKILSKILYKTIIGDSESQFNKVVFKNPLKAFSWGTFLTISVQSSSITTPLIVPLVALGKVSLKKAYPFIVGANIGTTITALLAALFKSEQAVSIAITHLIFNLSGVILLFGIKETRKLPIFLASMFGKITRNYRFAGFGYIVLVFFLLPFTLIYLNKDNIQEKEVVYEISATEVQQSTFKIIQIKSSNEHRYQHWLVFDKLEAPSVIGNQNPNQNFDIHIKNNLLLSEYDTFYLKREASKCWKGEDVQGKYQMCLENTITQFETRPGLIFDSVNVYIKNYSTRLGHNSIAYDQVHYYLDLRKNIFVQKSFYLDGKLVENEKIIKITYQTASK